MKPFDPPIFSEPGYLALCVSPGILLDLIDGIFQLMILWTQHKLNMPSLPTHIDHYQQFTSRLPSSGTTCICRIVKQTAHQVTCNVELLDSVGKLVAQITGYHCITDMSLREAFTDNQLGQKVQA